jgi:RNA-directed DNA polymerase
VKFRETETTPNPVPNQAKLFGEIRDRWFWVEPSVWTERMLTALERGVKGGRWYSLMDKVYSPDNLQAAFERVKKNKGAAGVDRVTIERFGTNLPDNLERLAGKLVEGTYRPQAIRRVWIPKPGGGEKRPLGIPTVRDRVVQAALRNVLEPIFERDFAEHSYGFRPGRGAKDALSRVENLLDEGYSYVVDADLKSYFDTIPTEPLLKLIKTKMTDNIVLNLVEAFLKQEIWDGLEHWNPAVGAPQGAVISPLLSNIYLDPLDHLMADAGYEMVRYADDFVILCGSLEDAQRALQLVTQWTESAGLTLHPDKTRIVDATQHGGFDFLGYHFERGFKWPSKKSVGKFKDAIRAKTKRTNGTSLKMTVENVNRTLKGWFAYFNCSNGGTYRELDGWVRMRLRSILRKRHGGKGRGRGNDHLRWPNAFFAEQRLFSLVTASVSACQSSKR